MYHTKEVNKIPIKAKIKTAPNNCGISKLLLALIIILPKPLSPENHSATTAPITASGIAILKEANKYGYEFGMLALIIISDLEASKDFSKSVTSLLVDLIPARQFTSTGKNVMIAAINILGMKPNPNQITNNGAIAIIGVTLTSIATGNNPRYKKRD